MQSTQPRTPRRVKDEPVARLFDALVAPLIAHQSQCLTVGLGAQGLADLGVRAVDDVVLRLQDRLPDT